MKKFLVQKTIEAEPMLKHEAETKLGKEIGGNKKDSLGFLTCDMNSLQWEWTPQNKFDGVPFDTQMEQLAAFMNQLKYWETFFKKYNKAKINLTKSEQLRVYKANRHIKSLLTTVKEIININLIQQ